jgi:peroxiredoxin
MIRKIFVNVCIVVVLVQIGYSQDWIKDVLKNPSDVNLTIDTLKSVMKAKIGTRVQNIKFKPITNYFFSEKLEDYKDNAIIMMFWNTNCRGCKMQLPDLSTIQEKYEKQGLKVIYLSYDSDKIQKKFFKTNILSGVKGVIEESNLDKPFQYFVFPTTFIISKGKIMEGWVGPEKKEIIEKRIQPYITQK